jgi:outer membrane immunogenic protein
VTTRTSPFVTLLALTTLARVAIAAPDRPWDGIYAGVNAGTLRNNSCNGGTLNGTLLDPTIATAFQNPPCSGNSAFVGGLQIGDDVQYRHLLLGIGIDLDIASAKKANLSRQYPGDAPPPGTYAFSGRLSPTRFAIVAPRIGYASLEWLAYLKAGALLAGGSRDSTLSYIPPGAKSHTASFGGGNNFASTGWAAGAGIEYGFNGPWSITAEYLHASLGKGSNSTATCSGTSTACAPFAGFAFDSIHDNFTANIIRIGINHWFGYWGQ